MDIAKRILLFALICFVRPALAKPAEPPVILVMGDSLSAAYGIETSQGWVALLEGRLSASGYKYHVVNASVSGETTAQGLTRLPVELAQHRPAIVILELGANDGLRGLSIKAMQANLAKMIVLSKQSGAEILLLGILLPPNYGPEYTKKFSAVYVRLSKDYHVSLVPFLLQGVARHRQLLQSDGMHPMAVGESKVLDNVWVRLVPLLKKLP